MNDQKNEHLVIFSNREPYSHVHTQRGIEIHRPASGLVSALEPVLREFGGLWIAHGSGSADAETCDQNGMLAVPPEDPRYQLKRVWLSPSERRSYYDGFSNEGLWPLFHLAHHEPTFRRTDWESYNKVNERFAQSLSDRELESASSILVQDFHLALVPRFLRSRLPKDNVTQKIALTWHIPWIPAEIFRICPWPTEILEGMLGADLITFHTASYCLNFLECCERLLECRVDREKSTITLRGAQTRVIAAPIGIDPPPLQPRSNQELRQALLSKFGIAPEILGLGVDRLDYTKGIPQRLLAIERFLEQYPSFLGRFSFLQIASPSRTEVPAYRRFALSVEAETKRINEKFQNILRDSDLDHSESRYRRCPPIHLVTENQDWECLGDLYRSADVCIVSSLHDGMNLVAKEYVWTKTNLKGALLLSKFTGASQELREAFLFNPYDQDESARAIYASLIATEEDLKERMTKMHARVASRDSKAWADEIITSLREPA
ncbi:trehalose-6-phosphate synthase [bacterium]|nr:trehalose-6-phosphate synthase [bacterium]